MIEGCKRVSKNYRHYLASPKIFYGIKGQPKSSLNEYSKPEILVTTGEKREPISGLRSEVSKFSGWVTIDENKGMFRKNAPETEIGKQKLTEAAKRKNRPEWMTQVDPNLIKRVPGNSYRNFNHPVSRSLFDVNTFRHNFDTQL
jgi:hypothetical protein